jgi:hypothetical protein
LIDVFAIAVGRAVFEWIMRVGGAGLARMLRRPADRFTLSRPTLERVFIIIACIAMALVAVDNRGGGQQFFDALYTSIENTITLFVFLYVGLFGATVMTAVQYLLNSMPLTFDSSRLYAPASWTALGIVLVIAGAGWWMSRAGEPMFGNPTRS